MTPRKILAIKIRTLGDTVIMTAPLLELRRAYPEAEIHVVCTRAWAPILELHPAVNRVIPYDRHKDAPSRAKTVARLALQLRKEHYDVVVNFHAGPSSSTLAFATGAKVRSVHFHGHKDKNRYSTVVVPGKGTLKPIIERDMDAVRALGHHVPAGRIPQIFLHPLEVDEGAERLAAMRLKLPVLALGLGASRPTKSWPLERFAALAISWAQKSGGSALGLSGPDEGALTHDFLKLVDDHLMATVSNQEERAAIRARIACETGLPIRKLAALISQCSVFAGNDSGPKHIAVAVDTPSVTIFGPEHPFEWHPYPTDMHPYFFVDNLPCRKDADPGMPAWCALHVCIEEQHKCMRQIGVEPVLTECLRISRDRG